MPRSLIFYDTLSTRSPPRPPRTGTNTVGRQGPVFEWRSRTLEIDVNHETMFVSARTATRKHYAKRAFKWNNG